MGWLHFAICLCAAVLLYRPGPGFLFWIAVAVAVVNFWSFGVMHNFAMSYKKRRMDLLIENMKCEGRPREDWERLERLPIRLSPHDAEAAPDTVTTVNLITSLGGVALLIWGVVATFF